MQVFGRDELSFEERLPLERDYIQKPAGRPRRFQPFSPAQRFLDPVRAHSSRRTKGARKVRATSGSWITKVALQMR
jgi:hypothetical protein